MEILRALSLVWSMSFLLVMFLMLYDLRFTAKQNWIISVAAMMPFIITTAILLIVLGQEKMALLIFCTLSLPSLIFFMLMAKKPDGRFFSTFALLDTLCYEVIVITMLLERWIGGVAGLAVLLLSRLILFPLLTVFVWKIRKPYKEIMFRVKKGWWLFAIVTMLFYTLLAYMASYPTIVTDRPDDIPTLLMLFIIMPLTYFGIFGMLINQNKLHDEEKLIHDMHNQAQVLKQELAGEKLFVEQAKQNRHDMRHILQIAVDYINKGEHEKAHKYLSDYIVSFEETSLTAYCENETVNALLCIYARKCSEANISLYAQVAVPSKIRYSDIESGTLFGNLFENAYEAALKCQDPFIRITASVKDGKLYVVIQNSTAAQVEFCDGLPVTTKDGGGIGMRSVTRLLDKYNGMIKMEQTDEIFTTQIIQPL